MGRTVRELTVNEGALFVALALVPGFASRNRNPELYAIPVAMRARMRARRLRAFLEAALEADEAQVERTSSPSGALTLTVRRREPKSAWTLVGDDLDAAIYRYLLERGGAASPGHARLLEALPDDDSDALAHALDAMPKLLGLR
jgi:hypothetical protein